MYQSLHPYKNSHQPAPAGAATGWHTGTVARRYSFFSATNPELIKHVQRLRYQVYCIENSYEDPARFPDRREHDAFDSHSVQGMLYDTECAAVAGTVRLILPRPGMGGHGLPIQDICRHPLVHDQNLLSGGAAEISRFAISKEYRRKSRHQLASDGAGDAAGSAAAELLLSHMTLGLAKGLVEMSARHGISDWFAVMEPSLLRLLERLSIYFTPLGQPVEYHGVRQPCYANLNTVLHQVRRERPDVWDVITESSDFEAGKPHHLAG